MPIIPVFRRWRQRVQVLGQPRLCTRGCASNRQTTKKGKKGSWSAERRERERRVRLKE